MIQPEATLDVLSHKSQVVLVSRKLVLAVAEVGVIVLAAHLARFSNSNLALFFIAGLVVEQVVAVALPGDGL